MRPRHAAMHFKVRPLRIRCRRLPWREVLNGPVFEGDLRSCERPSRNGVVEALTLAQLDPAVPKPLPNLYEPVLLGFAPLAFQIRGFEHHEGPGGAVQRHPGELLRIAMIPSG